MFFVLDTVGILQLEKHITKLCVLLYDTTVIGTNKLFNKCWYEVLYIHI